MADPKMEITDIIIDGINPERACEFRSALAKRPIKGRKGPHRMAHSLGRRHGPGFPTRRIVEGGRRPFPGGHPYPSTRGIPRCPFEQDRLTDLEHLAACGGVPASGPRRPMVSTSEITADPAKWDI